MRSMSRGAKHQGGALSIGFFTPGDLTPLSPEVFERCLRRVLLFK
jgi:hypothetical protein